MISLILTVAFVGVLVFLLTKYVPMPDGFKTAIYIIAVVCVALYVLRAFGLLHGADVPVPQLN
jgi:predicted membrane channel-forming protein YqfA (hemolysin III family)